MWISNMHRATHCLVFARTHGKPGDALGITAFFVPRSAPGFHIESYEWTFTNVFVPDSAVLGEVGKGLPIAQTFVHGNRLRQAASSLSAAEFCIEESIKYARRRKPFGRGLAENQGIQFPIVELATQAKMLKLLILKTAAEIDGMTQKKIERYLGDKVFICNASGFAAMEIFGEHELTSFQYWGNRLCTQAADRVMQIHGKVSSPHLFPIKT
ncbi:hypothetical protein G7Y89_g15816 [Cudoniella acicularis]|uniref:Acyl-CoA dehydrogenase/oxidase C-terminal domain-containing protein n=1 Tax=Cudoniella acicularis TaxID=354080 RepID=A0A8H4VHE3_9HELO|nr:hypothetical protein G7Y89_g15816 [Cudoniella acicularis]